MVAGFSWLAALTPMVSSPSSSRSDGVGDPALDGVALGVIKEPSGLLSGILDGKSCRGGRGACWLCSSPLRCPASISNTVCVVVGMGTGAAALRSSSAALLSVIFFAG